MTRTTLRALSATLIGVILAVGLFSCTGSEQQAQLERAKRIEQQEAQDAAKKAAEPAAPAQPQAEATPEASVTPEPPAEPEKVDNYEIFGTVCQCMRLDPCGVTAYGCADGRSHACAHDVTYKVVQVDKTDDNSGKCD